jgi:hypothetical protein
MASAQAKNRRVTTRIEEVVHHTVDTGGVRMNLSHAEAEWLMSKMYNYKDLDDCPGRAIGLALFRIINEPE